MSLKKLCRALLTLFFCCIFLELIAQKILKDPKPKSASSIKEGLEKLNVLGTVLYFAAHPDDENTRLIAWLANEKKYRTAYLSLTRGDGGQNLLGLELGIDLGLIRTQEMMAARSYDHGEQFFSTAYDFGFSKTHLETFNFWNKEEVLREAVYIIRKFRPDVIINRFPPDERGGHGHHQASAIISREAFEMAADPTRFPEQVREFGTWQAKRLLWNTANFGGQDNTSEKQLKIQIGDFNPVLGQSYGEMAAISRSQHKSQGFGAASSRGESFEYFEHVSGVQAKKELLDGVQTSWERLRNTGVIQEKVKQLNHDFKIDRPEASIPALVEVFNLIQKLEDPYWKHQKSLEVQELILACAGVFTEATVELPELVIGSTHAVNFDLIVRRPSVSVHLTSVNDLKFDNKIVFNKSLKKTIPVKFENLTQPYWLRKPYSLGKFDVDPMFFGQPLDTDNPAIEAVIQVNSLDIPVQLSIQNRRVDPIRGELYNPIRVMPNITVKSSSDHLLFANQNEKYFEIEFHKHGGPDRIQILVNTTGDFESETNTLELDFQGSSSLRKTIKVKKSKMNSATTGYLTFTYLGSELSQYRIIQYDHIPTISRFLPFKIRLEEVDIQVPVRKVAYLSGAGDLLPEALRGVGVQVDILTLDQIQPEILQGFDALILGVRAYNVDAKLFDKQQAILDYVYTGGVVLVQYQVNGRFSGSSIGPYPFEVTRSRVTEENASVTFLLPQDPVLNTPNKLSSKDFEGWVQERGLYYVEKVDSQYRQPLGMHDVGEKSHSGALILTQYGEGKFVYTSLSLFRQLPAGVPGSYRLLMNLLSKEKY